MSNPQLKINHPDPDVRAVGDEISNQLAEMERYFKPGMKLTFIARFPGHPDRGMLITSDDLPDLIEEIRHRTAEARSS